MKFCWHVAVLGVGLLLLRLIDLVPGVVEAAEEGGVQEKCARQNGDVNADGTVDLSDAVTVLGYLFRGDPPTLVPLCKPQGSSGLPDTGQTICYDESGEVVDCASGSCPGQDGFYQTGCAAEGRFIDNGDGTVSDTCTGLMWQKDTADTNGDGARDVSDGLSWCHALAYCEDLTFGGHDDWRLPNVRELQSIVDYGRIGPAIDPVFSTFFGGYWSSTSSAGGYGVAWLVFFGSGAVFGEVNSTDGYVRAVRGGR
jgi:hypothetical protein